MSGRYEPPLTVASLAKITHLPALDDADPGDDAGRRRAALVRPPTPASADELEERRPGIDEAVDPLPRVQLAALVMPLERGRAPAAAPRARCARGARRRAPPSARGGAGTRRPPCRCGKRARSSAETVYPRPEPGKAARLPIVTFGVLTVIVIAGLGGPLLSASERVLVPVVVGELLAGLVIGRTGFHLIHPADPTLAFMAAIGFAMLMFGAGMKVPLRTPHLGTRLVRARSPRRSPASSPRSRESQQRRSPGSPTEPCMPSSSRAGRPRCSSRASRRRTCSSGKRG